MMMFTKLDVTGAYRLGNHWRAGIGTDIGNIAFGTGYFKNAAFMPVFARVKYNLLNRNWSPFAKIDYGYAFSMKPHLGHHGTFYQPAIGRDMPLGKGKLYLQVGYTTRHLNRRIHFDSVWGGELNPGFPGLDEYERGHFEMFDFSLGYTLHF